MRSSYDVFLLGDSAVGKTSLVKTYIEGPAAFNPNEKPSSLGFVDHWMVYQDRDREVGLEIWDAIAHELYEFVSMPYGGVRAAVIVYDITRQDSFRNAKELLSDIFRSKSSSNVFKALVGAKADLVSRRRVTYEDGRSYAQDNGMDLFMEVSALTGENVEKLFLTIGSWKQYSFQTQSLPKLEKWETPACSRLVWGS